MLCSTGARTSRRQGPETRSSRPERVTCQAADDWRRADQHTFQITSGSLPWPVFDQTATRTSQSRQSARWSASNLHASNFIVNKMERDRKSGSRARPKCALIEIDELVSSSVGVSSAHHHKHGRAGRIWLVVGRAESWPNESAGEPLTRPNSK